jgi:multidrug efflux pump subunit AcrA (membrane-fusion protein)
MKKTIWISILTLTLVLSACGQSATAEPVPTVVLDNSASDSGKTASTSPGGITASAEVRPLDSLDLSFPLLGTVKTVDVGVGDKVTAGQAIATLDTVILEARVTEAEANVAAAEAEVAYQIRSGANEDHIAAAQAEVDRTRALVDQAKATLAQATLYTPISGTVVSVDVAPGETANPGQVIIVVADLNHMRIETTDLSERDIPAVQLRQTANVFIDALNETFEGQVVDIDRQSETVGGDVTYKVTIDLNEQPAGLRWGMSAEVDIQTEQ